MSDKREHSLRSDILEVLEVHCEEEADGSSELRITFAVEINPENLAAAFYMDGSASMEQSGNYGTRGVFARLGRQSNPVQDAMRTMVPYVAGLDANGTCRTAYWATGSGQSIEVIGELTAATAAETSFPGPSDFGNGTYLLPAVRDFIQYVKDLMAGGEKVERAFALVITDGQLHDLEAVVSYTQREMAPAIKSGQFPPVNITVVGVGRQVDEEQLEELEHEATPEGQTEIFHFSLASEVSQLPELVAHLVDEAKPAFFGGATVVDEFGTTVATYEDMVPAVLVLSLKTETRFVTVRTATNELRIPVEHHEE